MVCYIRAKIVLTVEIIMITFVIKKKKKKRMWPKVYTTITLQVYHVGLLE